MKLLFIASTILLLNNPSAYAQKKKNNPPGTVKVNDTLFADKTEVNNLSWREYLYYLSKYDSAALPGALPDTSVWMQEGGTMEEAYTEFYFRHPSFNNYPVVGISYNQAVAFCKWRTRAANFAWYIKENKIKDWENHMTDSFRIKFYYRLPTAEEWESLAFPSVDTTTDIFKKKGKPTVFYNTKEYNIRMNTDTTGQHHFSSAYVTVAVNSFFPGKYKTYNLTGNVAEMTTIYGIAKGGSFEHTLADSFYKNIQTYTKPERWLGFRCVAVWLK